MTKKEIKKELGKIEDFILLCINGKVLNKINNKSFLYKISHSHDLIKELTKKL